MHAVCRARGSRLSGGARASRSRGCDSVPLVFLRDRRPRRSSYTVVRHILRSRRSGTALSGACSQSPGTPNQSYKRILFDSFRNAERALPLAAGIGVFILSAASSVPLYLGSWNLEVCLMLRPYLVLDLCGSACVPSLCYSLCHLPVWKRPIRNAACKGD